MADPQLVEHDKEIPFEDQGDIILKTLWKYLGPDRKTSKNEINATHQHTSQSSEVESCAQNGTCHAIESDEANADSNNHRITSTGETCFHVDNDRIIAPTASVAHCGGFDITLSPQNEMLFTHAARRCNYTSETNIPETGPSTKSANITEQQTESHSPIRIDTSSIDDQYQFNHKKRGYMVLIVNDQILNDDDNRKGAHEDLRKMDEIGVRFGFEILNSDMTMNLSKPNMKRVLRKAQQVDHTDCDCFALMISTHGGPLPSLNNNAEHNDGLLCADGEIIEIGEIIKMFDDDRCPSLEGKPKMFFIQACRGLKMDDGNEITVSGSLVASESGNCSEGKSDTADTKARYESPSRTKRYESPSRTTRYDYPSTIERYESPSRTKRYESPSRTTRYDYPSTIERYESPSRTKRYESPPRTTRYYYPSTIEKYESHLRKARHEFLSRTTIFPSRICDSAVAALSDDETPNLSCSNDMLVMFAAPPGMIAWRNEREGSWMIHRLHEVLMEYDFARPKNLLNVLTKVCRLVSQCKSRVQDPEFDGKTIVPVIEYKLTKYILF